MLSYLLLTYSMVGAVAGILAGLLGIGGGLVIVPMLVFCFSLQQVGVDVIMHLALGTSMASIIFTSLSSLLAHHKRGAVGWLIVRRLSFGIVGGTFAGACLAARMSTVFLTWFFVIFLYYVSYQMMTSRKPKMNRELPGRAGMFGTGIVIGSFSSLVGIGGGTMSVPFMVWCNISLRNAIGTSAAIGLPIALSGTVGYIYNGLAQRNLPLYSCGYVYLPALVAIICGSILTAPLGVRLAHSLPVARLKRIFAFLLFIVATKMLLNIAN